LDTHSRDRHNHAVAGARCKNTVPKGFVGRVSGIRNTSPRIPS
jgi:hypothetical protein